MHLLRRMRWPLEEEQVNTLCHISLAVLYTVMMVLLCTMHTFLESGYVSGTSSVKTGTSSQSGPSSRSDSMYGALEIPQSQLGTEANGTLPVQNASSHMLIYVYLFTQMEISKSFFTPQVHQENFTRCE